MVKLKIWVSRVQIPPLAKILGLNGNRATIFLFSWKKATINLGEYPIKIEVIILVLLTLRVRRFSNKNRLK